jgi:hypothetical protein
MLRRNKTDAPATATIPARPRYTIKLDEETYYMLDRWKAKIRIEDPTNRITITDIVKHGIHSACAELEERYGKLDD